ncbi:transglycosylase domain-containing protein [Uliginosibacterium paludis]|uniref:peptidoglycan glycosyltransferase n=1 Tax=Uliginosibacterium paludis TaxID=1615952 RepID=A0ABV2CSJ4_9RHOO
MFVSARPPRRLRLLLLAPLLLSLPLTAVAFELPSFEQVRASHVSSDAILLDRSGVPLADLRLNDKVRRLDWVPLTALSPAMREALLAAEDKRFYTHSGIDWLAFAGAAWQNLWGSGKRGASTLTMQLAGLLDPALRMPAGRGERRSLAQKWDQSRAAVELENHWSKAQILEAYLNLAPFRGDLQGISAASELLFDRAPGRLTHREASLLAALLRGPNAAPAVVSRRACQLLANLRQTTPCSEVTRLASNRLDAPRNRSRFTAAPHLARKLLRQPGQIQKTTLDAGVQTRLRAVLALRNSPASVLVLDNASAEVRAWVGALEASAADGVTQTYRLPEGVWPLLAATAIDQRLLTAASPLRLGNTIYDAHDGRARTSSWMSLRAALGGHQTAAMAELQSVVPREDLEDRLRKLDLDAPGSDAHAGSNLLQLAAAWRSLAAGGQWQAARWQAEPAGSPRQVWRSETAFIVQDMLATNTGGYWQARWVSHAADSDILVIVGGTPRLTLALSAPAREAGALWQRVLLALEEESRAPTVPEGLVSSLVRFEPADEAPRREWFLPGTAMELVTMLPDGSRGRILSPQDGEVLTLPGGDPARRHLIFRAAGNVAMRWWVDGEPAGDGEHLAWIARPGHHLLTLTDSEDRLLQRLPFFVREAGPVPPADDAEHPPASAGTDPAHP